MKKSFPFFLFILLTSCLIEEKEYYGLPGDGCNGYNVISFTIDDQRHVTAGLDHGGIFGTSRKNRLEIIDKDRAFLLAEVSNNMEFVIVFDRNSKGGWLDLHDTTHAFRARTVIYQPDLSIIEFEPHPSKKSYIRYREVDFANGKACGEFELYFVNENDPDHKLNLKNGEFDMLDDLD